MANTMLTFKHVGMAYQWHLVHSTLTDLVQWIVGKEIWGPHMVVTSVFRDHVEQQRVNASMLGRSAHGVLPVRAADVRIRDLSETLVASAAETINDNWQYDFDRPNLRCALIEHDHMHIQVHPHTQLL